MITEPSEQTWKSIDRHRESFAKVKGVGRNAVDQMLVGNSHDVYIPFRERYQKECWAGCDTFHYIDDLMTIQSAAAAGSGPTNLTEELVNKFNKDATLSSALLDAIDGGMTESEARQLLKAINGLQEVVDRIRHAAHKKLGTGMHEPSPIRKFGKEAVERRQRA